MFLLSRRSIEPGELCRDHGGEGSRAVSVDLTHPRSSSRRACQVLVYPGWEDRAANGVPQDPTKTPERQV